MNLLVYVNNSTWKHDVSTLMKYAVCLLVRIRNTESCIWELDQALTMLKKVNIIVDDLNEYKIISQNHQLLPEIDELPESGFVLLSYDETESWVIHPLQIQRRIVSDY